MRINAALQAYAAPILQATKSPVKGNGDAASPVRKTDSVEISQEGKRRLAHIQSRIESGYYNSSTVAEDISDKLSKVLNDIT